MTIPPDIQKQIEEVAEKHAWIVTYDGVTIAGNKERIRQALTEIVKPLVEKIEKLQQLVGPLEQYRLRMECACGSGTATQIQMLINEAEVQREVATLTQQQLTTLQAKVKQMKEAGDRLADLYGSPFEITFKPEAITNWRNVTKEL